MKSIKKFFKSLGYRISNSRFVAHISFLWHWKNFFFLLRYPFYRMYNRWKGTFMGYRFTEYDSIPKGWRKAFGKQMSKDIKAAGKASRNRLGKMTWKEMLTWEQIKEKYGGLRLYASATSEIQEVLDKYEVLSQGYCIRCGKPARYMTKGWIEYYCEDCFLDEIKNRTDEDKQKELKRCRLGKKDIPYHKTFTKNKNGKLVGHKVDLKKRYGIDFEELWGLKMGEEE